MISIFVLTALLNNPAYAGEEKERVVLESHPSMTKVCLNCHDPKEGVYRGYFENVAFKSKTIQIKVDEKAQLFKFDDKSIKVDNGDKVETPEYLRSVKKSHEVAVSFEEKNGEKFAKVFSIKPPINVPPEKLISVDEVEKLVQLGPDKGKYVLIDSRPLPRFQEGYIPTAINLPFPAFKKLTDRLPKDKETFIVFYCAGLTCQMSPKSGKAAEKLGYKNYKIFHGGIPDWSKKNYTMLTTAFLKEAWLDKDIPHILIDVRKPEEVKDGFIKGAVNFNLEQVKKEIPNLPKADKKAPIIVYDSGSDVDAIVVAKELIASGQTNVKILAGGFKAWANNPVEKGTPGAKFVYVPKPRPGEISIEEFEALIKKPSKDTLILDVRNQDEANAGMLKKAKLIPAEDLVGKTDSLPKDKLIVTHCSTGVRAEMAYHTLKEKGFNVKFLNATIEIDKKGNAKITKS